MSVNEDRIEEAKLILNSIGQTVNEIKRVNNVGDQIRTREGTVFTLYDKGTIQFQGKTTAEAKSALAHLGSNTFSSAPPPPSRNVFVAYGHDIPAREQLETILHRWELNPIFLDQLASGGQTLIEKLEKHQSEASFAVVLATPDDEGYPRGQEVNKNFRARQNVVLELGMLLNQLGRANVAVLYKGPMELPSDIAGLVYIEFKDHINDARALLFKEFMNAGIRIDPTKF